MATVRIRNMEVSCITFKLQKCAWLSRPSEPPPNCSFYINPLLDCTPSHFPEIHAPPNSQMDLGKIRSNIPYKSQNGFLLHLKWIKSVSMAYQSFRNGVYLLEHISIYPSLLYIPTIRVCTCHVYFRGAC